MIKSKLTFDFENKYIGLNYDEKIEQKIIISEKENIDFNEWNTIKEKIKNNIGIL